MSKRLLLVLGLSLFLSLAGRAQDNPKAELFGGYSYGNVGPVFSGAGRTNLNGWNASLSVNLNRWFGLVTDFSGHYGSFSASLPLPILVPPCTPLTCGIQTSETDKYHTFLFGPRFSFRTKKLTPFVHALLGGSRVNQSGTTTFSFLPPPPPPFQSTFNFSSSSILLAFAGGGGVDYELTRRFAWRLQADYLEIGNPNRVLNNFRLSSGIVIRF